MIRVPFPGLDRIVIVPSSSLARSCIEISLAKASFKESPYKNLTSQKMNLTSYWGRISKSVKEQEKFQIIGLLAGMPGWRGYGWGVGDNLSITSR